MTGSLRSQAALAACVGHTLGAPFVGRSSYRAIHFYEPIPVRMAPSASLDSWLVARAYSGPAEGFGDSRRFHLSTSDLEGSFGARNARRGLLAPFAGSWLNPVAYGSSALGRTAVWSLISNSADEAAERAFWDAACDHDIPTARVSACLAWALFQISRGFRVKDVLVQASRLVDPVERLALLFSLETDLKPDKLVAALLDRAKTADPQAAAVSLGVIAQSWLAPSFEEGVCLAAGMGGASDQSALLAAMGQVLQGHELPSEWLGPLGNDYVGTGRLSGLDAPASLNDFAKLFPDPDVATSAAVPGDEAAPTPEPTLLPPLDLPKLDQRASVHRTGDLRTSITLGQQFGTLTDKGLELVIRFDNLSASELILEPSLEGPAGSEIATRLTSTRLTAGQSIEFPTVIKSRAGKAKLTIGETTIDIPLIPAESWSICGPFANVSLEGYDKHYACEDILSADEVFNGRSGLPVKWTPFPHTGTVFAIEEKFGSGAGVIYLGARVKFPTNGMIRMVVAGSPGAVVEVNRERIIRYQDQHVPVPRAVLPYLGKFEAKESNLILIKVLRNELPASDLVVYFLNDTGDVISPQEWLPLA